jgi:hypothetical protein
MRLKGLSPPLLRWVLMLEGETPSSLTSHVEDAGLFLRYSNFGF